MITPARSRLVLEGRGAVSCTKSNVNFEELQGTSTTDLKKGKRKSQDIAAKVFSSTS